MGMISENKIVQIISESKPKFEVWCQEVNLSSRYDIRKQTSVPGIISDSKLSSRYSIRKQTLVLGMTETNVISKCDVRKQTSVRGMMSENKSLRSLSESKPQFEVYHSRSQFQV